MASGKFGLVLCCFVAIVNSATIGYDSSMMNGLLMLPSYYGYLKLTTATLSLNNSIVFVGACLITPFAGSWTDQWGRKWGIAIGAILTIIGAVLQAGAVNVGMFAVGRLIVGASITVTGTAAPTYVAEIAHPDYRSATTALFNTAWYVGGIMAAGVTLGSQYITGTWSWRLPDLLQMVAPILCILPLPLVPESPRWLIYNGRTEEALNILANYHGNGNVNDPTIQEEYSLILETIEAEKAIQESSWKTLIQARGNRWRTLCAVAVGIFCNVSGNNVITYYLSSVLNGAGYTDQNTQLEINLGMNCYNLVVAMAGTWAIDRMRRRPNFFASTALMSLFLILVAVLTKEFNIHGGKSLSNGILAMVFLFFGAYSFSWTPLAVAYPVEVLSYSTRAKGMAAMYFVGNIASFINLYVVPYMMKLSWIFYLICAGWNLVELVFMYFVFPETCGLSLEETDRLFDATVSREDALGTKADVSHLESSV